MTSHIKLYGSKSTRFEQLKEELQEHLGYEPSNPEVVGFLMASYAPERLPIGRSTSIRRID